MVEKLGWNVGQIIGAEHDTDGSIIFLLDFNDTHHRPHSRIKVNQKHCEILNKAEERFFRMLYVEI